jgi:hypothetical protein
LHAYCSEGRHAVAGAWAEGPLGSLKSWPTSRDTAPSNKLCRSGCVSSTFITEKCAMPVLGLKSPRAA